ncbi:glycoside hydrolase superfamily [Pilobolus umbonatus]|nr:glycoside hydrolase superfamily [Pilobolus umbonatus]
MSFMAPLFSIFAVIPIILSLAYFYIHQRALGYLDITTTSVQYNRTKYHDILDWDKHSLIIEGIPTQIHSGEFHYWRVPDRTRWSDILKQYRSIGLNTIRIYFHWGYHSPDEGVYLFDGNRDIDYLLSLCEELGLFVLAAPGPYICAETQGGGYPSWLVAKRELNIRHNKFMLWREYDATFAEYEIQWLNHILPIIGKHQITDNTVDKKGCVLALQIDNELFEKMSGILPVGLHDQMRVLAKAARDAGITLPLFTNDGFEEGSWVPHPELDMKKNTLWKKKRFGIDLYGFDKYVVFAPSSAPKSWIIDSGKAVLDWDEWTPETVENSLGNMEKTVRGFGGGAADSPILIPELQGGWFNHYQLQHTYDEIYEFYGEDYTKLIVDSVLAQGVTMESIYMVYGGTNWGTLGDPDVYTSYDYSACIREFGMVSSRARNLRKTLLLVQSFDPYFTRTERVMHPSTVSSVPYTVNLQRVSVSNDQKVVFTFFRNFDRQKRDIFEISHTLEDGRTFELNCHLPYKKSFIGVGNYTTKNDLHLYQSTIPILARMVNTDNDEVWIVEPNTIGGMAFKNKEIVLRGNMQDNIVRHDGPSIIISFERDHGWTQIETVKGSLYIIGLTSNDSSTLYAEFKGPYWNGVREYPSFITWGADTFYYNRSESVIEINHRPKEKEMHLVSFKPLTGKHLKSSSDYDLPFIHSYQFDQEDISRHVLPVSIFLNKWEQRTVDFDKMPWKQLTSHSSRRVTFDAIDHQYLSGHVLYRTSFKTPDRERPFIQLTLNCRHRATVILNGQIIGGHTTYSRQLYMPGAKIGPDPTLFGAIKYDLSPYLSHPNTLDNQLVVVVESFGLNRQAFLMNDIRNARGIISVSINGLRRSEEKRFNEGWEISGVDVRTLVNPFLSTGLPDEHVTEGWHTYEGIVTEKGRFKFPIHGDQGMQWFRFEFDNPFKKNSMIKVPLRLRMDGQWTAYVSINGIIIARYYGNGDGPQHDFYIPEDLVQNRGNEVKILCYSWTDTVGELKIAGWPVLPDSGNMVHANNSVLRPDEYMLFKNQLKL